MRLIIFLLFLLGYSVVFKANAQPEMAFHANNTVVTASGNSMMGTANSGSFADGLYLLPYYYDGGSFLGNEFSRGNSNSATASALWSNSANFFQLCRTMSSGFTSSRAALQNTNSISSSGVSTYQIYLGAINMAGTPGSYSVYEMAYADINTGLTTSEMTSNYNGVQVFETAVGAAVAP